LPAWLAWFDISFEVLVAVLLFTGVLFRIACPTRLPILIASMIIYGKNGFYFPSGGIELPIFWASVQASLVLSAWRAHRESARSLAEGSDRLVFAVTICDRLQRSQAVKSDVSSGGIQMTINFKVNGSPVSVDAPADTPLLWAIPGNRIWRNEAVAFQKAAITRTADRWPGCRLFVSADLMGIASHEEQNTCALGFVGQWGDCPSRPLGT
jgi:hypothetical protein